jgi:hypothetical protein
MAYYHNMIGGPSNVEATFDSTGITYDPEDAAPSGNPSDNVPDMMGRRSWILDGVTLNVDGHTQGNSLN